MRLCSHTNALSIASSIMGIAKFCLVQCAFFVPSCLWPITLEHCRACRGRRPLDLIVLEGLMGLFALATLGFSVYLWHYKKPKLVICEE